MDALLFLDSLAHDDNIFAFLCKEAAYCPSHDS